MNWKNQYLIVLIIALAMASCDSFEDDFTPQGEQELELISDITVLPNTPLLFDLKRALHTAEKVKFDFAAVPKHGDITLFGNGIMKYKPHDTFVSGSDLISLSILNEQGALIDTDSIVINMASSADSLPCFNGALSDYYSTGINDPFLGGSSIIISPILNDGYCAESTSGAILDFIEEPSFGHIEQVELFTYKYTPNLGFTGTDSFRYELTLVDNEGVSFYSMAEVRVEVLYMNQGSGACDSLVYPFEVFMTDSVEQITILPFKPGPACDVFDWTVSILNVSSGSAIINEDNMIEYTRGQGDDSVAVISYNIQVLDFVGQNEIYVLFDEGDHSLNCLEANDDSYHLYIMQDSIGTESEPYYLNISANDIFCDFDFELNMLTEPHIGVATIDESNTLVYYVNQEFAGIMETSFEYEICKTNNCQSATVYLTVEQ
ncbi:MAG: hypothetical protein JXR10_14825 [Cyclobacteriaceae bacterium]